MKPYKYVLALIALFILVMCLPAVAQTTNDVVVVTNTPAATNAPVELPPGFEQVADLLGPKVKPTLIAVMLWLAGLKLVLMPFAGNLGRWLRDKLNKAAEDQTGDADEWLAKLFKNPLYRFASTLVSFVGISFPNTAELERALKIQQEAVQKAIDGPVTPGGS